MIKAFLYLLVLQLAGVLLSRMGHLPIPGTVMGFMLLFLVLLLRPKLLGELLPVTRPLLDNMMLLFVPVSVGIMQQWPLLKSEGGTLLALLLASQVLGFAATALTMRLILTLQRRLRPHHKSGICHGDSCS